MKKIICKHKSVTRKDLADPNKHMSYHERLSKAGSIDLIDNHIIEDCGNGYIRIKPIDQFKITK